MKICVFVVLVVVPLMVECASFGKIQRAKINWLRRFKRQANPSNSFLDQDVASRTRLTAYNVLSEQPEVTFTVSSERDPNTLGVSQIRLSGEGTLTNSDTDQNPTATVDIGQSRLIGGVILGGRPTWPTDYPFESQISVSGDNINFVPVTDRLADNSDKFENNVKGDQTKTFLFSKPEMGRYIRITSIPEPGAAVAFRIGVITDVQYDDPCASSPCQNGAACSIDDASGGFSCACASGFSGATCSDGMPAESIGCTLQVRDGRFAGHALGEIFGVICQTGGCGPEDGGSVWGTDNHFTDDSSICQAARHMFGAGALPANKILQIKRTGASNYYAPGNMNGVQTKEWVRPFEGFEFA